MSVIFDLNITLSVSISLLFSLYQIMYIFSLKIFSLFGFYLPWGVTIPLIGSVEKTFPTGLICVMVGYSKLTLTV